MSERTYGDDRGHPGCHGCQICWGNAQEVEAALDDPDLGSDLPRDPPAPDPGIFTAEERARFAEPPTDEELAFWERVVEADHYPDAVDDMRMIHEIRRLRAANARLVRDNAALLAAKEGADP